MCHAMWQHPTGTFKLEPKTAPWVGATVEAPKDRYEAEKKAFGLQLAQFPNDPFKAASNVFKDTATALWVSQNWLNDPVVLRAKQDIVVENEQKLLDKTQFQVKLLTIADEKVNGFYLLDGKDRIAALKLYAETEGWIGKVNIDASSNTFIDEIKLTLVKAQKVEKEQPKVIEHNSEIPSNSPINLKLVSAR